MQTLEIQLSTSSVGYDGRLNYKGKTFEAHGITKGYIKARLAKLITTEYEEGVTFTFAENSTENSVSEIKPMKKKNSKVNIDDLPMYSNPTLVVAGDKAKFNYDKSNTDFCVVDILKVETAGVGTYISWAMEHDNTKAFRTFVRAGNPILDEPEFVVGTTIPMRMVKMIVK